MELKTWIRAQWDRVAGALAVVVGLLALLLGYQGVADTPYPAEQIPYVVSGGVLGICLVGIGLTAWISADLRDEWHKLDRMERLLERAVEADDEPERGAGVGADAPSVSGSGRENGQRTRSIAAESAAP